MIHTPCLENGNKARRSKIVNNNILWVEGRSPREGRTTLGPRQAIDPP
jgi:hypothetical protein